MECTIIEQNVKILEKILSQLTKISTEIYLDAQPTQFTLTCFNSAHSNFTRVSITQNFFSTYETSPSFQCKFNTQTLASAFKVKSTSEKSNTCKISASISQSGDARFLVVFLSLTGIRTTRRLFYESVYETFNIALLEYRSKWRIAPRLVSVWLSQFPPHTDISIYTSLKSTPSFNADGLDNSNGAEDDFGFENDAFEVGHVRFRSFNDNLDGERNLSTEVQLDATDFEVFESDVDSALTTSLLDFKIILGIAEALGSCLEAKFSSGGIPLEFEIRSTCLVITCVLATVPVISLGDDEEVPGTPSH